MAAWALDDFRRLVERSVLAVTLCETGICLDLRASTEHAHPVHSMGSPSLPRPPFAHNDAAPVQEYLPAVHRLRLDGLGLGPTHPGPIDLAPEPSGFRCGGSHSHRATHSGIRTSCSLHQSLPVWLLCCARTLPYHRRRSNVTESAASVRCLAPLHCRRQRHSTSELLRTLSRMAASKPTSWLSLRH